MDIDVAGLRILHYPDPALREVARPVSDISDTVRAVAARMIELMHEAEGVGLAAPQVGLPWRLFVSAARDEYPDQVYLNPRLHDLGGELSTYNEGCLSLPGIQLDIRRPSRASITATDLDGQEFTCTSEDLLARAWQHECDHLDGILIIDKMSPMDRIANRKLLKELEAAGP